MAHRLHSDHHSRFLRARGFTFPDFLFVLAGLSILVCIAVPVVSRAHAKTRLALCTDNLRQITGAVIMYAEEHKGILPLLPPNPARPTWWWYKELVKKYADVQLTGPSSPRDKVFACPNDRGYDQAGPFAYSAKFDYTSYVFNGVNLPGVPNVAGRAVSSIKTPGKTLLMMEFTAHAPLSWHNSKTGPQNHPFYSDAESVVGFVDGRVRFLRIYYDGIDPAFSRDPIPGYEYKYSGD